MSLTVILMNLMSWGRDCCVLDDFGGAFDEFGVAFDEFGRGFGAGAWR